MLRKSFISSLYVIPATAAVILFATHMWTPGYLITPPELSGFEQQIEFSVAVLLILLFSFILPNKYEIELGLVNGYGTLKLALAKAVPVFVYALGTSLASVALYRYTPFDLSGYKSRIPVFVPDDFRVYSFLSVALIVIFFSSVYFFLRVLTRNCFLPIIADLAVFSALSSFSDGIRKGINDLRLSVLDPFITTYFVGNAVPNGFADKYADLSALRNVWTVNRLIFLTLSVAFLAATIVLLRREKLHRGLGE